MKVALEATVLELEAAGVARSVRGLREALAARPDVEVISVAHRGRAGAGRVWRGLQRELLWAPAGLARRAREADVLHCPYAFGPLTRPRTPLVVTVHDVLAHEHPAWFSRAHVLQQRLAVRRLCALADAVVTPSGAARDALLERVPVRASVEVIPWGVGEEFSPAPAAAPAPALPYVLALGTLQPRKGLDHALAAWQAARRAGLAHRLVVAGATAAGCEPLAARLRAGGAELVGRVDDATGLALLRGADALLFASRHEGFGFPPLEAMACGTPVVAHAASSVPEVCGGAALLADPADPDALGRALIEALSDPALAATLRARGLARAHELTWERCAAAYTAIYARLA